jgi:transposase
MQTVLTAPTPRVECPEHGVRVVKVPWAQPQGRFTALFEAVVIEWLKVASIKAVAVRMGLSWDQVDGIQARAVERGLARRRPIEVERIGVDETSFQKRHEYVTVVSNMDDGTVLHVADDRTAETLEAWYRGLGAERLARLRVVAMDMWPPYIAATRRHVADADNRIVFDKFHVAMHLGEAVDRVRRREQRELRAADDDRLKGTKHLWLTNPDTLARGGRPAQVLERFDALRSSNLRTARAYAIKEAAMEIWSDKSREEAERSWRWWHGWAVRSRLEPMKRVARMIKSHLGGVLNAIVTGTTNAMSESINAQIQRVKRMACGFRNRQRFRNAIYFHLGGLDLYPNGVTHSKA